METLVFLRVANLSAPLDTQLSFFDPGKCFKRAPAECWMEGYDSYRRAEALWNAAHGGTPGTILACCEFVNRSKGRQLNRTYP
jgi:hypothetical protein